MLSLSDRHPGRRPGIHALATLSERVSNVIRAGWIPAYAGMTGRGMSCRRTSTAPNTPVGREPRPASLFVSSIGRVREGGTPTAGGWKLAIISTAKQDRFGLILSLAWSRAMMRP